MSTRRKRGRGPGGRRRAAPKRRGASRGRGGAAGRLARLVSLVTVGVTGIAIGIGIGTETIDLDTIFAGDVTDTTAEVLDVPPVWNGPNGEVEIEVLNGGGVAGMAGKATDRLRRAGFDVVVYGNAASFDAERQSAVIARSGNTSMARAVADTLGIDNVLSDPNPNLYVDVTVVVGGAWTGPPKRTLDGVARRLWDPRTWFGG